MFRRGFVAFVLGFLALAIPLFGADEPVFETDALVYAPPPGFVERAATMADLVMASPRLLDEHRHHIGALSMVEQAKLYTDPDGSGEKGFMVVGVQRALPRDVRLGAIPSDLEPNERLTHAGGLLEKGLAGTLSWTTAISSEGAGAVRLYLRTRDFPAGSKAYVYSARGEVHGPYDLANAPREGLWANTVFAEEVFLEVQLGSGDASDAQLTISEVTHIEHPHFAPRAGTTRPVEGTEDSCFMDASCVSTSEWSNAKNAQKAIGVYLFNTSGGETGICSGGLLADTKATFTPYYLTANHCFTTQASATSMEMFWRYMSSTCNGSAPDPSTVPRTTGATLLATNASSDFTFVRLSGNPPSGSVFLGWQGTTNYATTPGVATYRMHHAYGEKMRYARHETTTVTGSPCGISQSGHFFSWDRLGGTAGGSSGSPVMLPDLKVIGQLRGGCGPDVSNNCDRRNYNVDGAFRTTYSSIQQYLAPAVSTTCTPDATTACLLNKRIKAQVRYRAGFDNNAVDTNALVKPVTGFSDPSYETAFFYFNSQNNIEMMLKVLDQGNTNTAGQPTLAVLFGTATPLRIELTLTDTKNGAVKKYTSNFGSQAGSTDFTAFVK
ncbi:MAG: hypothetical protein ACYC7A_15880 [Thermoanaerobaculia bacterium]